MMWIDGTEIDPNQYSGESLCKKLALDMWALLYKYLDEQIETLSYSGTNPD